MKSLQQIKNKIHKLPKLKQQVEEWKAQGLRVVFTNGCFDLLHRGHIDYLAKAASLGDKFILALNSDASVKRLKGENRPLQDEQSRALMVASLQFIDAVVLFEEDTPEKTLQTLLPHILVKGADYAVSEVIGGSVIMKSGGSVVLLPYLPGYSTTSIENKLRSSHQS